MKSDRPRKQTSSEDVRAAIEALGYRKTFASINVRLTSNLRGGRCRKGRIRHPGRQESRDLLDDRGVKSAALIPSWLAMIVCCSKPSFDCRKAGAFRAASFNGVFSNSRSPGCVWIGAT